MQDLSPGPALADRTVERVIEFWRDWVTRPASDAVSLVAIGEYRLMSKAYRSRVVPGPGGPVRQIWRAGEQATCWSGSQGHGVFDRRALHGTTSRPIGEALRPSLARRVKADLLIEVSRSMCIAWCPQEHFLGVVA